MYVLGPATQTGKNLLIALTVGVVVATLVFLADAKYHFLPANPMAGPSAAARAGKTFWPTVSAANSENLVVPAALSPTTQAASYTMSIQMILGDSRAPSLGRFRHVLHRGSNTACNLTIPTKAGSTGHAGIQVGDLPPSADASYRSLGLPDRMNPGLMLDKFKNDLHVFVHTKGHEDDGRDALWLESTTVEDLPLNTPITIGVVCNGRALEVYVNCRLWTTLFLRGTPYLAPGENQWFGRYCAFPMTGLVKQLQLWADPLSASDYAAFCSVGSFNPGDIPKAPTGCPK